MCVDVGQGERGAGGKRSAAVEQMESELAGLYDEVLTGDEDVEEQERRLREGLKARQALDKWAKKMRNKVWVGVGVGGWGLGVRGQRIAREMPAAGG